MAVDTPAINEDKLNAFMGQIVGELGATVNAGLIVVGDRLGLYRAMAGAGPISAGQLAKRTKTTERYVREWLNAQAAGGFVEYDPATDLYLLPAEQAMALADEGSPAFVGGAFQLALATLRSAERIESAFKSGGGVGWHEHDEGVPIGCERFFRPGYSANLVSAWLPALEGVEGKLRVGATVADVGYGLGASTLLMAMAYPKSTLTGFDSHQESIERARERAAAAGLGDRTRFEVALAAGFPGAGYDLVTMFDCLHDMGDPVGAARHVRKTLAADGTWMIVEPMAGDRVEQNLNPVGRAYYSFSTFLCIPSSMAQEVEMALGAQAGEARIREVTRAAGFTRFRRVAETPFNAVYEGSNLSMSTRFTELVGCELPLQLATLGGVGTAELAAAVAREGGLGMMPGGTEPPGAESSPGALGIGFLMPFGPSIEEVTQAAGRVRVVEFFYGEPRADLIAAVHGGGALGAWQVGSVEEALAAEAVGCDFVVAQGREAGGHVRGTTPLLELLPKVLAAVKVPVVAAGGIGTAADVKKVLALGADAVRVGTRFVACEESGAHPDYVRALIAAQGSGDTVLTSHFSEGWPDAPHRVLRIALEKADRSGNREVMPPNRARSGDVGDAAMYAGEGVGAVTASVPAAAVVRELMSLEPPPA